MNYCGFRGNGTGGESVSDVEYWSTSIDHCVIQLELNEFYFWHYFFLLIILILFARFTVKNSLTKTVRLNAGGNKSPDTCNLILHRGFWVCANVFVNFPLTISLRSLLMTFYFSKSQIEAYRVCDDCNLVTIKCLFCSYSLWNWL